MEVLETQESDVFQETSRFCRANMETRNRDC